MPPLADAIVDRILERGRLLRLDGPSVRTKHLSGDELASDTQDDSDRRRISGIEAAEFPEPTPPGDEMRRQLRDEQSRPIVKRIEQWALATRTFPESGLRKALEYMGGVWKGLVVFLDDPRVPLHNNSTERSLRSPAQSNLSATLRRHDPSLLELWTPDEPPAHTRSLKLRSRLI